MVGSCVPLFLFELLLKNYVMWLLKIRFWPFDNPPFLRFFAGVFSGHRGGRTWQVSRTKMVGPALR